jgi:hypothetical protein
MVVGALYLSFQATVEHVFGSDFLAMISLADDKLISPHQPTRGMIKCPIFLHSLLLFMVKRDRDQEIASSSENKS